MSKNFFEEFAKNDFFEKKASENENIKSTLGSITPSVLEKLAEEIGALSEQEDMTLEQKLASEDCSDKEVEKEEEKEKDTDKEAEAEVEVAGENENDSDADTEEANKNENETETKAQSEVKSEVEAKKKAEDTEEDTEKDTDKDTENKDEQNEEDKKDTNNDDDEKESKDCSEDELKKAYEVAEQKLASAGFTVVDYVLEKVASENTALFVTENAEKLAFLSDKPILQVADEIISTMAEKLG